jgi:hypothetical protein
MKHDSFTSMARYHVPFHVFNRIFFYAVLLVIAASLSPRAANAQIQEYLVCNNFCRQENISIEYPADYTKSGADPDGAWFVHFGPGSNSLSSVSIFVSFHPSDSLRSYYSSHVDSIRYSSYYQNPHILRTGATNLGGSSAYEVLFSYTSPSNGVVKTGLDILAFNSNGVYTLSFLAPSSEYIRNLGVIAHVENSFRFLS